MSTIFYTSDLHLGHDLVAEKRGFATIEEHTDWITDLWDTEVSKRDQVIILGDFSIGRTPFEWLDQRPGVKHLITGNHDPVFLGKSSGWKQIPRWQRHFKTVQGYATQKISGQKVLLNHFPYASQKHLYEDRVDDRYLQYRMPDMGLPLIHGHVHDHRRYAGNMLHVGLDAWNRFVTLPEVVDWVDNLQPQSFLT